ncbi:hypothetical protein BJX76DRAFT_359035 [Aspergillus varians]
MPRRRTKQQHRQLRQKMQKQDVDPEQLRDPILHLNQDIMDMVFDHLSVAGIINCGSLNQNWGSATHMWIDRYRQRVGKVLRPFWYSEIPSALWTGLSDAEIKEHAFHLERIQTGDATSMLNFERSAHTVVVYSPIEAKILWEYSFSTQGFTREPSILPLALGRSLVYCAMKQYNSTEYDLAAFNFRANKLVYRRPLLSPDWTRSFYSPGLYLPPKNRSRLIHHINGEEFILIRCQRPFPSVFTGTFMIDVIRGRDGHRVYRIPFSPSWFPTCLEDPLTKQAAFIWTVAQSHHPPALMEAHPRLSRYHVTLVRPCSYHPKGRFALLDVMAVLHNIVFCHSGVLQPFSMTAIGINYTYTKAHGPKFRVSRLPLLPVHSAALHEATLALARWLFRDKSVRISGCFTLGHPKAVSVPVPPEQSSGNQNRVCVDSPNPPDIQWLDHARLLVSDSQSTRIVRF